MAKDKKILEDWPNYNLVAGLDEVGRGCGAGPIVTAAVIMPKAFNSPFIRDSKKLSEAQRNVAYKLILDNAISVSCCAGSVSEIDSLGINLATFKTMHQCIDGLVIKPEYILVDGITWEPYTGTNADNTKVSLIPKGDDTYTCIAAAAIVAKVRRDEYMCKIHALFPRYNWGSNKGYLTPDHISVLKEIGVSRYHRKLYVRNFVK